VFAGDAGDGAGSNFISVIIMLHLSGGKNIGDRFIFAGECVENGTEIRRLEIATPTAAISRSP
jgi:hypothetical protein